MKIGRDHKTGGDETFIGTVLVVSPHPDDESIGAPATLLHLRRLGYRVINYPVGMGRGHQHEARLQELKEACKRSGFELMLPEVPAKISIGEGDDLTAAEPLLVQTLTKLIGQLRPDIVVSPNVHDAHRAHELVGRATRDAIIASPVKCAWWSYAIWSDLQIANVYVPFDDTELIDVQFSLNAYASENARNNYQHMLVGRSTLNATLGSERIFGFGTPRISDQPYAELLLELIPDEDGAWWMGEKRVLDHHSVIGKPTTVALNWWVEEVSPTQRYRDSMSS